MTDTTDPQPTLADEMDALVPDTGASILIGGVPCTVNRIRTREMLALLRILTRGLGPMIQPMLDQIDWSSTEGTVGHLGGMIVIASAEAPDATIEFVRSVVTPEYDRDKDLTEQNMAFVQAVDNPDPVVIIDIIDRVVEQEREDIAALVGKAKAVFAKMTPVIQAADTAKAKAKATRSPGGRGGRGRAAST
jgi:hypothetical protein